MQTKQPGGYLLVWLILLQWVVSHFSALADASPVYGVGEAMVRGAHIVAAASTVALMCGMIDFRPWLLRAAHWWAIAMVTYYGLRLFAGAGELESRLVFGEALLYSLIVGAGTYYVGGTAAERLGLAPPPAPVPRVTSGTGAP